MKSLDNYTGHKNIQGVYQKIINQIPADISLFVELFAGSAAITQRMNLGNTPVELNDIDPKVKLLLEQKFKNNSNVTINDYDYFYFFRFITSDKAFIFIDPPYLHATRKNNKLYKYELTDAQHIKLLQKVLEQTCYVAIIHPACELYDTMLKDWRSIDIEIRYHKKTSKERLYMNYDTPTELKDYQYLGNDSWERQRIKKRVLQYIQKFKKIPKQERNYILNELNQLPK